MSQKSKNAGRALALAAALCLVPLAASAGQSKVVAPDPTDDPLLITAGFMNHHQDLKFRILGLQAYQAQRYEDAMRYFRRASYYADKPAQGMIAEMYWNGEGVPKDIALAYAWMDLAAERGYAGFLGLRERYWNAMNAQDRERAISEGQAVYARFGDAAAKPRYEATLRRGRMQLTGSRTGFNRGVQIEVPGPGGSQMIEGSKYYDERYWDAQKYWAWQDRLWMKPNIGRVEIGELETVRNDPPPADSRIPETAPEADAPVPEVPEEPAVNP